MHKKVAASDDQQFMSLFFNHIFLSQNTSNIDNPVIDQKTSTGAVFQ